MKKNYIQPRTKVHMFSAKAFMDLGPIGSGNGEDALSKGQGDKQGGASSMWENMDED